MKEEKKALLINGTEVSFLTSVLSHTAFIAGFMAGAGEDKSIISEYIDEEKDNQKDGSLNEEIFCTLMDLMKKCALRDIETIRNVS